MKFLKILAKIIGAIVLLIALFFAVIFIISESAINKEFDITAKSVAVSTDPGVIEKGKHIWLTRGCAECHGQKLEGKAFIDAFPVGTFAGSNLTSGEGGISNEYNPADWDRAIRHGVGLDGVGLIFMPVEDYYMMTDNDLNALVSYIKSVPPVDNKPPSSSPGPVFRMLNSFGGLELIKANIIDHDYAHKQNIEANSSAEYGEYLAQTCIGCHGDNYSGGKFAGQDPNSPPPTNITPHETGIGNYTFEEFKKAMTEGVAKDGRQMNKFMPYAYFKYYKDYEIEALWNYLLTLPPKEEGNR